MEKRESLVQRVLSPSAVLGPSWGSGKQVFVKTDWFLTSGILQSDGGDVNLLNKHLVGMVGCQGHSNKY